VKQSRVLRLCLFGPQGTGEGATTQYAFALFKHFPGASNLCAGGRRRVWIKRIGDQKSLHIKEL
jgi:hypothetical protein